MNLEDQVVNLELSKRLKELDIKQKPLFYWGAFENPIAGICKASDCPDNHWGLFYTFVYEKCPPDYYCATYTVAELLNILPHLIVIDKEHEPFNSFRFNMFKSFIIEDMNEPGKLLWSDLYIANYECNSTECTGADAWMRRQLLKNISDKNPANCLAKLLIELIENKLIEIKNEQT